MIRLPVQTFNRLANCVGDDKNRPFLAGVCIETTASGKIFATASDGSVLACEMVGFVHKNPFPSETIILPINHDSGDVVIMPEPKILWPATTPTCWVEKDGVPVEFLTPYMGQQFIDWRAVSLPKPTPKKPTVPVSFSARYIGRLIAASPSGALVFPEFVDVKSSVIVNDPDVKEWFGLFMPVVDDTKRNLQPAILPGWFE